MNEVFVTNQNDFYHEDRFNGQDFGFPKGEKVLVPVEAAKHMFAFGTGDKTEALNRLGWANPGPNEAPDAGVKKLANFVFTQAVTVEVPVPNAPAAEAHEEAA
jgi:hypothetical protein